MIFVLCRTWIFCIFKTNTYLNYINTIYKEKHYDTTYILIESMTLKCKRNRICWMERDEHKKQTIEHTNRVSRSLFVFGFFFLLCPDRRPIERPPLFIQVYEKNVSKIKTKRIKSIISCKMTGCFPYSFENSGKSWLFTVLEKRFVDGVAHQKNFNLRHKPNSNTIDMLEKRKLSCKIKFQFLLFHNFSFYSKKNTDQHLSCLINRQEN